MTADTQSGFGASAPVEPEHYTPFDPEAPVAGEVLEAAPAAEEPAAEAALAPEHYTPFDPEAPVAGEVLEAAPEQTPVPEPVVEKRLSPKEKRAAKKAAEKAAAEAKAAEEAAPAAKAEVEPEAKMETTVEDAPALAPADPVAAAPEKEETPKVEVVTSKVTFAPKLSPKTMREMERGRAVLAGRVAKVR